MIRRYATIIALIIGALITLTVSVPSQASEAATADPFPFGIDVDPSYVRIEHRSLPDGRTQVCVKIDAPVRFEPSTGVKLPAVHAFSCEASTK